MAKGKYKSNFRLEDIEPISWVKLRSFVSSFRGGLGNFNDDDDVEINEIPDIDSLEFDHHYSLSLSGDSMSPRIEAGEKVIIVVIDNIQIRRGDIVACYLNGDFIVKVFEPGAYHTMLTSINPNYEPIRITEDDTLKIIGKCIWKISKL